MSAWAGGRGGDGDDYFRRNPLFPNEYGLRDKKAVFVEFPRQVGKSETQRLVRDLLYEPYATAVMQSVMLGTVSSISELGEIQTIRMRGAVLDEVEEPPQDREKMLAIRRAEKRAAGKKKAAVKVKAKQEPAKKLLRKIDF